jgi:hypothetical protein
VDVIGRRAIVERLLKLLSRDRLTKSKIKLGTWIGRGNVPKLRFRFPSQPAGYFFGRMDLQR